MNSTIQIPPIPPDAGHNEQGGEPAVYMTGTAKCNQDNYLVKESFGGSEDDHFFGVSSHLTPPPDTAVLSVRRCSMGMVGVERSYPEPW